MIESEFAVERTKYIHCPPSGEILQLYGVEMSESEGSLEEEWKKLKKSQKCTYCGNQYTQEEFTFLPKYLLINSRGHSCHLSPTKINELFTIGNYRYRICGIVIQQTDKKEGLVFVLHPNNIDWFSCKRNSEATKVIDAVTFQEHSENGYLWALRRIDK